jgi:hypothetical protein
MGELDLRFSFNWAITLSSDLGWDRGRPTIGSLPTELTN